MNVARKEGDLPRNMDSYAVLHFIYHGATPTVGGVDWACACGVCGIYILFHEPPLKYSWKLLSVKKPPPPIRQLGLQKRKTHKPPPH